MTAEREYEASWVWWARLVRIPTVFTILADVSAAYFFVAHGIDPWQRWALVVAAGVCLYWAGMIFNDVFDVEVDREERPGRPLPAGAISLAAAKRAGSLLLIGGVGLAVLSGVAPADGMATTWLPGIIAALLAVMILLYDGPLKRTPLAPAAMGSCRVLSFLLGAAPVQVIGGVLPETIFPAHVWAIAIGFGVYVMGVTLMARTEARRSERLLLGVGLGVVILGLVILAVAPTMPDAGRGFRLRGDLPFAVLIGLLGLMVVTRGLRAIADPSPAMVGMTIRVALLTIIPLAASFALLGAGPKYGLGIFFLVIPALLVSARFRMT